MQCIGQIVKGTEYSNFEINFFVSMCKFLVLLTPEKLKKRTANPWNEVFFFHQQESTNTTVMYLNDR